MRSLGSILLILSIAFTAAASGECVPGSSSPEVTVTVTRDVVLYIDVDCQIASQCPDVMSTWTYLESNGIEGLQRDDEIRDDTCGGVIASDTFVFA